MLKYKIGVYAISKNEEKFVDRWVDSMEEADVIVVCDTGSTDHTIELLKKRGVEVYSIKIDPWRFDVPRNIAMDYLPEDIDICVSTDLDEVFEPGWREKIEECWKPETTRLKYTYTCFYHADGTPGPTYFYEKIHKRHDFRWYKPVHELLQYSGQQPDCYAVNSSIHLMHHPDPDKSRSQYLNLLELSVKEFPDDDRNMHYLGREYMYHGMYEKAIDALKKHLKMSGATWPDERCASMRFIGHSYHMLQKNDDAAVWLYRAIAEAPNRREPYLFMAQFANDFKNWTLVFAMVSEALKITVKPGLYLDDPACWDQTLYDLGGISTYYLGLYEQSYQYTKRAIELSPLDQRLQNNMKFVQQQLNLYKTKRYLGKQPDQQIKRKAAIVILTYNNLNYTKKCIASIHKYTKPDTYELILVDNSSTDGTREWLMEQKDIKYLLNDKNEGFPRGCNLGAQLAEKDSDLLFLNNDTEACKNWLTNLYTALYSDDQIGAVGPATSYDFYGAADEQGPIDFASENIERVQKFAAKNNYSNPRKWQDRNFLIGFCFMVKREAWDKVGGFDERFTPGNYEDNDYSVRLTEAGYRLLFCRDCYVHHYGSRSFHNNSAAYWELLNKNALKFYNKWNFRGEDMLRAKSELINTIQDQDRPMNILEYRCGLGATLIGIKNIYPQAILHGIDIGLYRKVVSAFASYSSVFDFPLEFPLHSMDYILIDDELERQADPSAFLTNIKDYLKPDGCIIVKINNKSFYQLYERIKAGLWLINSKNTLVSNGMLQLGINEITPFFESCGYTEILRCNNILNPNGNDCAVYEEMCKQGGQENEQLYKTIYFTYKYQNTENIDTN